MPESVTGAAAPEPATAGTTSTPSPAAASPPPAASPAAPPAAAAPAQPAAAAATPDPATPGATPDPAAAPPPLFTLPEDMKLAPEAVSKFEASLRPKLVDGKANLTAQEVVDLFADQARDANRRWQEQINAQNTTWESESKQRFNAAQLAAAETGVGFLSSFDPEFREIAKQFKNHPTFVNAMRVVGERLSEDTFEIGGAPPVPAKKSAAERMGYAKPRGN